MLTFKKSEHLCSKILISNIFTKGKHFYYYPFKVLWLDSETLPETLLAQLLISVPKKNISSAVARNKVKRRIREAYRKNKHLYYKFLLTKSIQNILVFHYTEKKIISYHEIEAKIILILQRLQLENEKNNH